MDDSELIPRLRDLRRALRDVAERFRSLSAATRAIELESGLNRYVSGDAAVRIAKPKDATVDGVDPARKGLGDALASAQRLLEPLAGAFRGPDVRPSKFYDRRYNETTYVSAIDALLGIAKAQHGSCCTGTRFRSFFKRHASEGWADLDPGEDDASQVLRAINPVPHFFDIEQVLKDVDDLLLRVSAAEVRGSALRGHAPPPIPEDGFFFNAEGEAVLRGRLQGAFRRNSDLKRVFLKLLGARDFCSPTGKPVQPGTLLAAAKESHGLPGERDDDDGVSAKPRMRNREALTRYVSKLRTKLGDLGEPYSAALIPEGEDGVYRLDLPGEHIHVMPGG